MADKLGIKILVLIKNTCRTMTKQLFFCLQLLVYFQPRHETDAVVISLCSFLSRNISYLFPGLTAILFRIELLLHRFE